jgi:predicted MFS family arabinose efflux permease
MVFSSSSERAPNNLIGFVTVAASFSVANLYYAQPLAETMARDFGTDAAGVSSALVGSQLGYAAGMLLLTPLCDVREKRSTIVVTAMCCALALLAFSLAPNLALLTVASLAIGLGSSVAQMLIPFAIGLGTPQDRGKIVGTVMGGVLAGILLSRTVSGALGAAIGWRAVFASAAFVMAGLAFALRAMLPVSLPQTQLTYRALIGSLWKILRREKILRRRAVIGALGFAAFSVFWSTIAFHLAHSPIGGGSRLAGMLGILGLSGIIVAPIVGRAAMRISPAKINLLALSVIAGSFAVFYAGADSLIVVCIGVVLMDAGAQANHLTNQTVIFGLAPEERSRVNAIYMVGYFLGGALGTAVAAQAWARGGWLWVCIAGAGAALLAIPALVNSVDRGAASR